MNTFAATSIPVPTVHSVEKSSLVTFCNSWMEFWAWLWFLYLRYRCCSCNKGNQCNHFHYVFVKTNVLYPGLPYPSVSISRMYGSGYGSGSFYHQAKKVKKNLIPTVL
jgi:hypothetical protein